MSGAPPEGWARGCIGDAVASITAGVSVNSEDRPIRDGEVGVLKTSCLFNGVFRPEKHKAVVLGEVARIAEAVAGDTVLVSRMNTPDLVGASAYVPAGDPRLFLPDRLWQVRARPGACARWLGHIVGKRETQTRLKAAASGTSGSMKNLSQGSFLQIPVPIPPLAERRRIAATLWAWDNTIDIAERLVAAKRLRFQAARQRAIEVGQSASESSNGWHVVELGELTTELTERNGRQLTAKNVMGVIKGEGLVPMRAHVMAGDLSRYLIVPPRAFAYNPMRLNIGSIAASINESDVLVSPDYVVFEMCDQRASHDFLRFFIGTKRWRDHLKIVGTGSVRTRIYYEDVAEMVLRAPSIKEQENIGAMLCELERDLAQSVRELDRLRVQKRALATRLLTGALRLDERFDPGALAPTPPEARP